MTNFFKPINIIRSRFTATSGISRVFPGSPADNRVKANIWKLYVIHGFRWFMVAMPIIVLFYQDNGLSMSKILILQAIFSLIIVFTEVPSGYFSDIVGRKYSIVMGVIFAFLGFLVYSFSFSFVGFLIAEILIGFGSSFISGADSALLYDSLLEIGIQDQYKKIEGRVVSINGFSEGVAAILGGFAALASLRFPVYLETAAIFLAIPFALSLVEPHRKTFLDNSKGNFKAILKIVKFSLRGHLEIKWLIIYSAIIGTSTLVLVWFIQPILQIAGLPLFLFGVFWATMHLFLGVVSYFAHSIENFFGRRKSLILLIVLSFIGYITLAVFNSGLWAIALILIFYFIRGLNIPILKDYMNKLIKSDIRATVLSVKALVARLLFSIMGPFIGWISDVYSLSQALVLAGILFAFFGVVSLLFLRKYKAL